MIIEGSGHGSAKNGSHPLPSDHIAQQHAPILKLPEEVLLIIFMRLKYITYDPKTVLERLVYVCRRWRYIAIHAPLLWDRFPVSYPPAWTAAAVARARTAPLYVRLDENIKRRDGIYDPHHDHEKAILERISSIRTLTLSGSYEYLIASQGMIPVDDAILLETLEISCSYDSEQQFVLSPTTFKNTRRLRRLHLCCVDIDIGTSLFRNLTTLSMSYMSEDARPCWIKLFTMLNSLHNLQSLSLHNIFRPSNAPELRGEQDTIWLSSLHSFSAICSTQSQMYVILAMILFPPLKSLTLQWRVHDFGRDQAVIFRALAEALYDDDPSLASQVHTLLLCQPAEHGEGDLALMTSGPRSTDMIITVSDVPSSALGVDIAIDFIDILGLSNITKFTLEVEEDHEDDPLLRLADKMPLLEDVTAGCYTASNFLGILGLAPLRPQSESLPDLCLPNLRHFTWTDGDLADYEEWIEDKVVDMLCRRRERGAGLQTLRFGSWVENVSPDIVGWLKRGVAEVITGC